MILEKHQILCPRWKEIFLFDGFANENTNIISKSGDNFISVKVNEKFGENFKKFSKFC